MTEINTEINLDYPEIFEPIFTTKRRYIDIEGGRGSGKSHTVAFPFLLVQGSRKKSRILCTREIQKTIKDSVHKLLSDKIEDIPFFNYFYKVRNDSIKGRNGTEFLFKGLWNNPDDVKGTERINYCWVEEAHSVSRKSLEILIPTIREPESQIIFTYNPTNDDDPVHVDYTLTDRPDVLHITANYYDNPFFPDVLKQEMLWDKAHDIDKYHHIWEGQPVKHSKSQIFFGRWGVEDFETPKNAFFRLGADWGFSNDPSCLVRTFIDKNNLYIDHEFYQVGVDIDLLPAKFKTVPESEKYVIRADSARPETISYMRRHGYPRITAAEKGPGSIEDGIEFLKSFNKIIIHPRCKKSIDNFRFYCYKTDPRTGEVTNKVEDKSNHVPDAIRYALEDLMKASGGRAIKTAGW